MAYRSLILSLLLLLILGDICFHKSLMPNNQPLNREQIIMTLLNQQQIRKVSSAVEGLNANQLAWVSGYFSGLSANVDNRLQHQITDLADTQSNTQPGAHKSPQSQTAEKVAVLFGSQTGNSRTIAESVCAELKSKGADVTLKNLLDYRPQQLKKELKIVLVISTHGNGEPPDEALAFYNFIQSDRAPKLDKLEFAVLGLGGSTTMISAKQLSILILNLKNSVRTVFTIVLI